MQMASGDRNFDDIADKLNEKIYGSLKGKIRLEVLARDLTDEIATLGAAKKGGKPLRVLDAGGGSAQFSAGLAAQGHSIVYCDISERMVELARQRFAEVAPDADVTCLHAPIQALPQYLNGEFDLILCHAVLEWLAEPEDTLQGLLRFLRPGGLISTLFYNKHSLMMLYLLRGRFDKVMAERLAGWGNSLTPTNPQDPDAVRDWFAQWGYDTVCDSGVRCFYDYITAKRRDEFSWEDILAAELKLSRVEAFRSTARYIHLLSRKPAG